MSSEARVDAHVELKQVSKHFGGVQALTGIDLAIARGSIHALVGENGAGKSTLGKIIAGVHRPDGGELSSTARRAGYRSPRDALADGITIIAQEPTLVPHRSVLENVFLGAESSVAGVVDGRSDARDAIGRSSSRPASSFRARALARIAPRRRPAEGRDPAGDRSRRQLIVMDEPTSALTNDEAERLFELVRGLRDRGTTIVYVSHFLDEVLALADTVTVLRDGRLVRTRPAATRRRTGSSRRCSGGDSTSTFPDKQPPPAGRAGRAVGARPVAASGACDDVSLPDPRGRDRRPRRADRERPIGGRPRRLRGRPRRRRDDRGGRASACSRARPDRRSSAAIGMLPEDRKSQGLLMLRSIVETSRCPISKTSRSLGILSRRASAGAEVRRARRALDVRAKSSAWRSTRCPAATSRRCCSRKWLFRPAARVHRRRADPRHRRGREAWRSTS